MIVNDVHISATLHKIIVVWGETIPRTLPNGTALVNLSFLYIAGTTLFTFNNTSNYGGDCEYADENGDPMNDTPTASFYYNSIITNGVPVANFMADKLTPLKNEVVVFTDLTTGGATSWSWSFDRTTVEYLNGTDFHSQNPQVKFTDGGLYSVTLLVANLFCSASEVKTAYLRAGLPGLWTGNTSSAWNTLSNWDNWLIPVISTDVVIPPSAPNWPEFDGNLTLGIHCSSLTLSSPTSRMTITGDLTVP